jgi:hypothetical protein
MFHARIASVGEVGLGNTHPFFVGEYADIVLAHNGYCLPLQKYGPYIADITKSDTRVFAESFLPELGIESLDTCTAEEWETFIGANKVAVLSTNPLLAKPYYIFGEKKGIWRADTDCWYSNSSYMPRMVWTWTKDDSGTMTYKSSPLTKAREMPQRYCDALEDDECPGCGLELRDASYELGECEYCFWCLECDQAPCTCYRGSLSDPVPDPFDQPEAYEAMVQEVLSSYQS